MIFTIIFNGMKTKRGRPPKEPSERKTANMFIPMTEAEKQQIYSAAESDEAKPITWRGKRSLGPPNDVAASERRVGGSNPTAQAVPIAVYKAATPPGRGRSPSGKRLNYLV